MSAHDHTPRPRRPRRRSALEVVSLGDVTLKPVKWLWPRFIPIGKVTLLAGPQGLGKSLVALDVAARVSNDQAMPGAPQPQHFGNVLILSAEDDTWDTVAPRLVAAGAHPSRVRIVKPIQRIRRRWRSLSLRDDLPALHRHIRDADVRLLVIDPINAFLAGVDAYRDTAVREVLAPLAHLAAQHQLAVVCVTHLTKTGRGDLLHRVIGSGGFTRLARAVLLVAQRPRDPQKCILHCEKQSAGPAGASLSFRRDVVDVPGAGSQPRIVWDEAPPDCEWDEALRGMDRGHRGPSALNRAVALLRSELARGPMGAAEITQLASRHGIDTTTLNRAKGAAGVESRRRGRGWVWKLVEPAQGAQDCRSRGIDQLDHLDGSEAVPTRPSLAVRAGERLKAMERDLHDYD